MSFIEVEVDSLHLTGLASTTDSIERSSGARLLISHYSVSCPCSAPVV